jgi:hypothetical protein
MQRSVLIGYALIGLTVCRPTAIARAEQPAAAPGSIVADIQSNAVKLRPLIQADATRAFLDAAGQLPAIAPRTIYRDPESKRAYTATEFQQLPETQRAACQPLTLGERFYYYTRYGSPLMYARPLDLYARAAGLQRFAGRRIFDFGYGGIGHLRMLAAEGGDAVGVEVQDLFRALYSHPEDQGAVARTNASPGKLTLIHGAFPGDDSVRKRAGDGYDLFIAKNVLKRGYIHPEREADPRMLIDLGVPDATFVRTMHAMLKPGGYALIYNLSPAQNPPDQPFIPWADGRCPFERKLVEQTGFEVLAWDQPDHAAIHDFWFALGYDQGQSRAEVAKTLFAHYTLLRRPAR